MYSSLLEVKRYMYFRDLVQHAPNHVNADGARRGREITENVQKPPESVGGVDVDDRSGLR